MNAIRFALLFVIFFFVASGELNAAPTPPSEPTSVSATASGDTDDGTQAEPRDPSVKKQRLWDIIVGGGWIMMPLAAISVWCLALIIESFIQIRLQNFAPVEIIPQLRDAFARENYQEAWRICRATPSFLTNTLRNALECIGQGRLACAQVLAEHALKESMTYRTKISYLSTIGVVSPMVGLLGTVTGMVKAFKTLGTHGIIEPSLLAAAIGEVLIATATGLMVAIPAFFMYYFFRNRLQAAVVLAEDIMNQLLRRVKYDEIQGIAIGEDLEMAPGGGVSPRSSTPKSGISQSVAANAVACPQCQAPIRSGAPSCPNCGVELQWEVPATGIQHQAA